VKVRLWIMVLLALLVGLVLGRLSWQDAARQLNDHIASLEKKLAVRRRVGTGTILAGARSMFNLSPQDLEAASQARRVRLAALAAPRAPTNAALPRPPAAVSNQIAKLKEAWLLRAAIARSNFVARVGLEADEELEFDETMDAMNYRLGEALDEWGGQIRQTGNLSPESGVRMINELSQAMLYAYDDLDHILPPDWRAQAGPGFDLMSFVDPEVLIPLQDADALRPPPGPP